MTSAQRAAPNGFLEDVLQAELDLSRVERLAWTPELRVVDPGLGVIEVHLVEDVEELKPEL
jgi:hypothetical protein